MSLHLCIRCVGAPHPGDGPPPSIVAVPSDAVFNVDFLAMSRVHVYITHDFLLDMLRSLWIRADSIAI